MELKWIEWAKQLQSIAQAGLTYSKDPFDIERFEAIRKISIDIMSEQTQIDAAIIKELFANETGYATPKVDIRAVVPYNNKLLMVQENSDEKWALPGGWADIGLSPREIAVKEVKEETGLDVKATKLLGILDKKFHPHPPSPYHVYKIFIHCEMISGKLTAGLETSAAGFFAEDELPPLSEGRNTQSQISMVFKALKDPEQPPFFD